MTWRNEKPDASPAAARSESLAVAACKALGVIGLFIAAAAMTVCISAVHSLAARGDCTVGQLWQFAWAEFGGIVGLPLLVAGVAFVAWRVLERRSRRVD